MPVTGYWALAYEWYDDLISKIEILYQKKITRFGMIIMGNSPKVDFVYKIGYF